MLIRQKIELFGGCRTQDEILSSSVQHGFMLEFFFNNNGHHKFWGHIRIVRPSVSNARLTACKSIRLGILVEKFHQTLVIKTPVDDSS